MNIKHIVAMTSLVFLLTGCTTNMSPFVGYVLSSDTISPVMATSGEIGSKTGTATVSSVLGISSGDGSITKAAANGGIKKIKTVDIKMKNIFGIYVEATTIVTGE